MKKHVLAALLVACAVVAAGCGNKEKETEAPKPAETAAARDTEAPAAQTAAQTEEAAPAQTEAAVPADTEAAAQTEAVEETEAAAQTEAAEETEAAAAQTEAAAAQTEEEVAVTEPETVGVETEADSFTETESEFIDYAETETEYIAPPKPEYDILDYLEIKDDGYKDLKIQLAPAQKVTDEEVEEEINNAITYSEDYDEIVDKIEKGKVKSGDVVNIDYVGTKDGVEFEGGSAQGYDLEIGSGSFIDGFEDGLIGKEIGSETDLNLTFPEDYGNEDLSGQDVVFHVTINYVAKTPELTDELAKKLSGDEYDNVEDYVESVRSSIQEGYDEEYKNNAYAQIMSSLMELYPIEDYPEENVEYYINDIMERYIKPYASMYGMSVEDFIAAAYNGVTEDEFREQQLIPSAQSTLAQEMILSAIAEKEGITMTDPELDKLLEDYAAEYDVTVDELTAGTDRETIRSSELQQKVMEWLYENVDIEQIQETEAEALSGSETEAETWSGSETEAETAEALAQTETEKE